MNLFTIFVVIFINSVTCLGKYQPTWESLDSRPLPKWFDEGKIGIFIHMGVYSVPSFTSEWFWCYWKCPDRIKKEVLNFMKDNYSPGFTYQDFARDFKLEFFNATQWIDLFERAGAKYAVLTSKHHEGFTLWPSKYSYSWNSFDVGSKRDIVGEFSEAVGKSSQIKLGLYHSLFEWFNPLYIQDRDNNFTTRVYPEAKGTVGLYELVNAYKPDLIWSDGDAGPVDYWDSKGFLAWLYNESPVRDTVVVNDRWGAGTACKHGGYLNCADRYHPGKKQKRKWENALTLDKSSWGFRRNANIEDYMSIKELLYNLVTTVANGGNLLVDVGPTKEGIIAPIMQERLLQMGNFLKINGEAIYKSSPWIAYNDSLTKDVFYTTNRETKAVYCLFFDWPIDDILVIGSPKLPLETKIHLLGYKKSLKWNQNDQEIIIKLPSLSRVQHLKHVWVLKMIARIY